MTAAGLPIAIADDDAAGPPRNNGELTFEAPWQGRAFGMCIALLEREGRPWDDFRAYLVAEIDAAPDAPYYASFALALERFAGSLGVI